MSLNKKNILKFYYALFILPGLLIYSLVVVFPVFFSIYLSFMEWAGSGAPKFVGMAHYQEILSNSVFQHGLRNNLLIVIVSTLGQIPVGLGLAYIIYRKFIRFNQFFQAMIFLPITVSAVIVAILWNQIFAPGGLYTSIVRELTNNPLYVVEIFENKTFAILPVLFVVFWYYTGTYMIIFLANMRKIPLEQIEAARIDGAKERNIFLRIITPQMLPVTFTCMILSISGSLKSFDLIFAMTGGGPAHFTEVISIFMYYNTFKYYKYGYGSAVSVIIIVLSLVVIGLIQYGFNRLEKKYN